MRSFVFLLLCLGGLPPLSLSCLGDAHFFSLLHFCLRSHGRVFACVFAISLPTSSLYCCCCRSCYCRWLSRAHVGRHPPPHTHSPLFPRLFDISSPPTTTTTLRNLVGLAAREDTCTYATVAPGVMSASLPSFFRCFLFVFLSLAKSASGSDERSVLREVSCRRKKCFFLCFT